MRRKTQERIKKSIPDFEELRAYGYLIHQFKPWHYRISHEDYETQVDVWPTVKKFWIVDSFNSATIYKLGELTKCIEEIFSKED